MNLFDLHCDTATVCFDKNIGFDSELLAVNSKRGKDFKIYKQCFAIFVNDNNYKPFEYYKNCLSDFKSKFAAQSNNITPIFTVEGGSVIENDTDRVYELERDGIKAISMTWNGETALAGGVNTDSGLKPLGHEFIEKLNKTHIALDVSHLNDKSFFKAIEYADKVIATHSCFRAVYAHKRNLSNEQLKLLKEKNAVIGLCFYPDFLGKNNAFEGAYEHLSFALETDLYNNIAVGSDFDGADMSKKLSSPDDVFALYDFLLKKGLSEKFLKKFFYNNADNFFNKL